MFAGWGSGGGCLGEVGLCDLRFSICDLGLFWAGSRIGMQGESFLALFGENIRDLKWAVWAEAGCALAKVGHFRTF